MPPMVRKQTTVRMMLVPGSEDRIYAFDDYEIYFSSGRCPRTSIFSLGDLWYQSESFEKAFSKKKHGNKRARMESVLKDCNLWYYGKEGWTPVPKELHCTVQTSIRHPAQDKVILDTARLSWRSPTSYGSAARKQRKRKEESKRLRETQAAKAREEAEEEEEDEESEHEIEVKRRQAIDSRKMEEEEGSEEDERAGEEEEEHPAPSLEEEEEEDEEDEEQEEEQEEQEEQEDKEDKEQEDEEDEEQEDEEDEEQEEEEQEDEEQEDEDEMDEDEQSIAEALVPKAWAGMDEDEGAMRVDEGQQLHSFRMNGLSFIPLAYSAGDKGIPMDVDACHRVDGPALACRDNAWLQDLYEEYMALPVCKADSLRNKGEAALRALVEHPKPLSKRPVFSDSLQITTASVTFKGSKRTEQLVMQDITKTDRSGMDVLKGEMDELIKGEDIVQSLEAVRNGLWKVGDPLYGTLDCATPSLNAYNIPVPNDFSPRSPTNAVRGAINRVKPPWEAVAVPMGAVTVCHADDWMLSIYFLHVSGRKLWLLWPPTSENRDIYTCHVLKNGHLMTIEKAVQQLDGLQLLYVEEGHHLTWNFPPGTLHAVITFSPTATHVAFYVARCPDLHYVDETLHQWMEMHDSFARKRIRGEKDQQDLVLSERKRLLKDMYASLGFWKTLKRKLDKRIEDGEDEEGEKEKANEVTEFFERWRGRVVERLRIYKDDD
ncbi:hypothetical protein D9613_006451 [Agrocybe pediades]|uniref:JmjC domain-containing protein n=1 Tax=Agrocybe pediades TaxID=84607 RepID=A0A8H4QHI7_9AGAR|nr:hypothetical protein D9613_006451 [Agrocybe pediades]